MPQGHRGARRAVLAIEHSAADRPGRARARRRARQQPARAHQVPRRPERRGDHRRERAHRDPARLRARRLAQARAQPLPGRRRGCGQGAARGGLAGQGALARIVSPARRALLSFAFAALVAAAWGAPNADEEELRALRTRIEKLQRDLDAAEGSRGEAVDQLKAGEKAVSESQRALFALARDRRSLESRLESIGARERDARAALAEQEALAGRLLRLQYRQGAPDRLRLILEGRDAATLARHVAYYDYIQRARAALIAELRRQGDGLAALQQEASARRLELGRNEAEQRA